MAVTGSHVSKMARTTQKKATTFANSSRVKYRYDETDISRRADHVSPRGMGEVSQICYDPEGDRGLEWLTGVRAINCPLNS